MTTTIPASITVTHDDLATALLDLAKFAPASVLRYSGGRADHVTVARGDHGITTLTIDTYDTVVTVTLDVDGPTVPFRFLLGDARRVVTATGKGLRAADKRRPVTLTAGGMVDVTGTERVMSQGDPDIPAPRAREHNATPWLGSGDAVRAAFTNAVRAAGRDETLPMLAVVALDSDEDCNLRVTSTDRFRLCEQHVAPVGIDEERWSPSVNGRRLLLPVWPVERAMARMRNAATLSLGCRDDWFTISDGRLTVTMALFTAGEFPRSDALWPSSTPDGAVTVDRGALRAAVDAARVEQAARGLRGGDSACVHVTASHINVMVGGGPGSDQPAWSRAVDVAASDAPSTDVLFGVNFGYLSDALDDSTHPTVTIVQRGGPGRPVLFVDATGSVRRPRTLVMPVRLPS